MVMILLLRWCKLVISGFLCRLFILPKDDRLRRLYYRRLEKSKNEIKPRIKRDKTEKHWTTDQRKSEWDTHKHKHTSSTTEIMKIWSFSTPGIKLHKQNLVSCTVGDNTSSRSSNLFRSLVKTHLVCSCHNTSLSEFSADSPTQSSHFSYWVSHPPPHRGFAFITSPTLFTTLSASAWPI